MTRKVCFDNFYGKVSENSLLSFSFTTFENMGRWKRPLRRSFNYFFGNTNLVLELTILSQFTLKRSEYHIPVNSDSRFEYE